ncbi:MAG: universal stress protein [Actinomycetota bacterium]|nr:universal stress protein [Actinomycetota bacterium]
MSSWVYVVAIVVWVLVGVAAVAFFLGRQGHRDPSWYLLGGVLGPLFVPVAAERAWRRTRRLEGSAHTQSSSSVAPQSSGLAVLVGVDGSPESDQAVRDAGRIVAAGVDRVILATVLDVDAVEQDDEMQRQRARKLLADRTDWLAGGARTATVVAAGQPARALLDLADTEHVDLVVVGRRGRGLSRQIMGSVAEQVTSRSSRPVLLAAPPTTAH